MTGEELKKIRLELGLTQLELGQWLRVGNTQPDHTVRMWEMGRTRITGPIETLLEAFLSGWRPAHIRNEHNNHRKGN